MKECLVETDEGARALNVAELEKLFLTLA